MTAFDVHQLSRLSWEQQERMTEVNVELWELSKSSSRSCRCSGSNDRRATQESQRGAGAEMMGSEGHELNKGHCGPWKRFGVLPNFKARGLRHQNPRAVTLALVKGWGS